MKLPRPRYRVEKMATFRLAPPPKKLDPIFRDARYLPWREAVLKRAGRACEAPGCDRSEETGHTMYADHIQERKDGGALFDVANGQCLCARHHTIKTNDARAERTRI